MDYLLIWLIRSLVKWYRKRKQQRLEQQAAEAAERAQRESLTGSAAAAQQAPTSAAADPLIAEAEQLSTLAEQVADGLDDDPASEALAAMIRADVVGAARDVARDQRIGTAGAPAAVLGRLRFRQRMLGAAEQLHGQRRDPARGALLREVDAVANACYAPMLASQQRRGIPLSSRRAVALVGETPGSLSPLLSSTPVAPVEVSLRLQHDVLAWPLIAREIGRDIVLSVRDLREQLRVAADLPAPRPTLPEGYLGEAEVLGALGVWQVELSSDAIGALLLGPAYMAALTDQLADVERPFRARVVSTSGRRLDAAPPPELRLVVTAEVLAALGFAKDADTLFDGWRQVHGDPGEYYFPTGDGRYAALPDEIYADPARRLAHAVCHQQLPSLAGMHLLDVPGLHQSLGRQRLTEDNVERIAGGHPPVSDDPRVLVAAVALAAHADPERRLALLPVLRSFLRPHAEVTHAAAPAAVAAPSADGPLDRAAVLDALVLNAILGPARAGSPRIGVDEGRI